MQKQQQHDHRQGAANEDILLHKSDRRMDILRFVVVLIELQSTLFQHSAVKFDGGGANSVHHGQHVGARRSPNCKAIAGNSVSTGHTVRLFKTDLHFGDIPDVNRCSAADGQDLLFHLFRTAKLAERADDPPPFAFP